MSLVVNLQAAYEALFLGELPYQPQPNEEEISTQITTLERLLGEEKKVWQVYEIDSDGDVPPIIEALE